MKSSKKRPWLPWLIFVGIALLAGGIGALLGGGFTANEGLNAPPLAPPAWLFPIVWTLLYIAMGTAAWLVWRSGDIDREQSLRLYRLQLAVNVLWTLWYFRLEWRLFAFFWVLLLIALVALTIRRFSRHSAAAGRLLIPYLLWLCFAAYLNLGYYVLNM